MLNDYLFLNQDEEIFERCGMRDDEVAEKHADYLAKKYNCSIECLLVIGTSEPPSKERE